MATPAPQGTLNRVRAAISFSTNPTLNVLSDNLGKAGINAVPISDSSVLLPTLTGGVSSPEPYQMYELTIHMLKTQGLAATYKSVMESLCDVGTITLRSDSTVQPDYQYTNGTIVGGTNPAFNGTDPEFIVRIHAIYNINSSLYNL